MTKEKLTKIGDSLDDLGKVKKLVTQQEKEEEKLYARRSINIKGYTLKLRSKIGDLIVTDIQANKNGTILEITLQNSENKEFEIKLQNSEENDSEIKTSWKQKSGNIIQLIFPKEKNSKEETEPQRTISIAADKNTQMQKAPDDVKKEEKQLAFSFQLGLDGPVKEFKKGEEFELQEIVSKNGEPKKVEMIKYKVEGVRTDTRNGMKFLQCLNLNNIDENKKVLSQNYTEFSEMDLKECLKNNWITFNDEKFTKELKDWGKKPEKIERTIKKNILIKKVLNAPKIVKSEEANEENQKIFNKINKLTEELTEEAPANNLEDAKDFYEHMLKNNQPAIAENAKQNLEKIKKIEELMKQREIIEKR